MLVYFCLYKEVADTSGTDVVFHAGKYYKIGYINTDEKKLMEVKEKNNFSEWRLGRVEIDNTCNPRKLKIVSL